MIQKLIVKLNFEDFSIEQLLVLVQKITIVYEKAPDQKEIKLSFLSFFNKIMILNLDKPNFELLW